MRAFLTIAALALSLPSALAQTPETEAQPWQQCGGITWKGYTTCTKGYICYKYNDYYSQCIPEPVLTSTSTTPPPVDTTNTPTPTTASPITTTTGCAPWRAMMPRSTGPAIRASGGWAAGLYLQKSSSSEAATLVPASSRGWFLTATSIRLIYAGCPRYLFLNIHEASESYKPLAFEATLTTNTWTSNGGTIGTTSGANTFVTCSDGALYLQTGVDMPTGNCTTTGLTLVYG